MESLKSLLGKSDPQTQVSLPLSTLIYPTRTVAMNPRAAKPRQSPSFPIRNIQSRNVLTLRETPTDSKMQHTHQVQCPAAGSRHRAPQAVGTQGQDPDIAG